MEAVGPIIPSTLTTLRTIVLEKRFYFLSAETPREDEQIRPECSIPPNIVHMESKQKLPDASCSD